MIPASLHRLFQSLLTLLCMSFAIYILIGLMPGDPVDLMAAGNPKLTPEDIDRLRRIHGLDRPLLHRYAGWLAQIMTGDFGYSRLYGQPVLDVILPRLGRTLLLLGAALVLTAGIAVPLGVYAAHWRGRLFDRAANIFSLAALSLPPFWVAMMLIAFFAVHLGWLPASGQANSLRGMVLPVATLTLAGLALYLRHTRTAMTETLRAAYIKTAQVKGCSAGRVLWRHAFGNAAAPVLTVFMLDLGALAGGAVTVETVFAFPGMGRLMYDAVMGNDFNLALAGFLFMTIMVLGANMAADAVLRLMDPRIGKNSGGA